MGHLSDAEQAFSAIYRTSAWGNGSGAGSYPDNNTDYMAMLQRFMVEHGIRSVVDFGCGDWQFSHLIDWSAVEYDGFDIVSDVVKANARDNPAPNLRFHHITDGTRLPATDLLLCKDVLQHLPLADIARNLAIFKQLYPHILITNDVAPAERTNAEIEPGQYRALRLDQSPFNETFDIVLSWDLAAYGIPCTKQTAYLRGATSERPAFIELRDR